MTTFLDRMLAPLGYTKRTDPAPPQAMSLLAEGSRWEMPDATVAEKQARLYAALTWIATAVDRTAELGSAGVYSVSQEQGGPDGDSADLPNHPFELLLRKPNPSQSRGEFLRDALSWYKVTGNLYLYLNALGENAAPDELWIVPSTLMEPIPDGASYVKGYKFTPPGKPAIFVPKWQVMHLKTFNPFSPFVGLSAVQSLALDAWGDLAQQKWNLSLFDKNAGRFPGVLAFKQMFANPEWERMVRERDEQWGGPKQAQVMMLRGVGDAVQWLPSALSQKEMDFLAGRAFTKEEIYGKLAPGLASILAVNATEANAIAGKSTLIEFGVWPMLEQLGQKFEAELLPLYGENLTGCFDDMRQTNRIMDLQEQAEFAKYHTVNEVRAEYYDEEPLYLDESQKAALEEDMAQHEDNNALALEQRAAAQPKPPAKKPAKAEYAPPAKKPAVAKPSQQLDPRGLMFAAQIGPATPLPGDATQPPPAPPLPPVAPPPGDAMPDKETPAKAEELEAWERFALKRLGRGGREFEPRALPWDQAGRIKASLKTAATEAAVRAVFARERTSDPLADAVAELRRFNDLTRA